MLTCTRSGILRSRERRKRDEGQALHVGSRGAACVSMLKAADLGHDNDGALLGPLNGPGFRTVHVERQVSAGFVVVLDILAKEPSQMILAEDKDVVQTLSPYTAVESLRIRILPGTMRRREDFFDAHVFSA